MSPEEPKLSPAELLAELRAQSRPANGLHGTTPATAPPKPPGAANAPGPANAFPASLLEELAPRPEGVAPSVPITGATPPLGSPAPMPPPSSASAPSSLPPMPEMPPLPSFSPPVAGQPPHSPAPTEQPLAQPADSNFNATVSPAVASSPTGLTPGSALAPPPASASAPTPAQAQAASAPSVASALDSILPPGSPINAPVETNTTDEQHGNESDLDQLFDRVGTVTGDDTADSGDSSRFMPMSPRTVRETGLPEAELEKLIMKCLFQVGQASGRFVSQQIRIPFPIVDPILRALKHEKLIAFKAAAAAGDYEFVVTDQGRDRARRYVEECTYFGSAPVPLRDYINSVAEQSMADQKATETDLKRAFSELIINEAMLDRLGPAVNSGRGLFLFGMPGNGKTSIAERVTGAFGSTIWVPRALSIDGEILRLYDPMVHEEVPMEASEGVLNTSQHDQRWVRISRPTVVAGGELTMDQLEVTQNPTTNICESPLQLKSNCGTLVIDDFGRQRMPVDELLNRWIVPLEKRYDFLNMPSGKKIQVPFDQLIIFSTNLEPRDLVDGAFLRRIPYKIEVPDPTEDEFRALCKVMSKVMKFEYKPDCIDYLVETHYKPTNRPYRCCQPRDLLLQVRNFCTYKERPQEVTNEAFDYAVDNYFSVM